MLLEKVVPYWKGRTSQEMYLNLMDPETRDIIYGDDDYGSTGMIQDNSNVSSTLNWPGNYDYVMENGMAPLREEAKRRIEELTASVEVGKIYDGTVLKLLDFGAIVQILPGKDGLLHISQIASERVNAVSDYLEEGQSVRVKVLETDERGRIKLSMKAAVAEENPVPAE